MTLRHAQGRALRQAQDNVPALVLTAGLATRLRPLSLVRAKAALPGEAATLGYAPVVAFVAVTALAVLVVALPRNST